MGPARTSKTPLLVTTFPANLFLLDAFNSIELDFNRFGGKIAAVSAIRTLRLDDLEGEHSGDAIDVFFDSSS